MKLDESKIKKYYKVFGYINLLLSIAYLVFERQNVWIESLGTAFIINAMYHMLYWFFLHVPNDKILTKNNFNKYVGGYLSRGFLIFGIFCSVFLLFYFVFIAIETGEYRIYTICIPVGLFLGAYLSLTRLNQILNS